MTFLNMDAPTQDQLEIPVQPRKYRDLAKGLEESPRWVSKMMGVAIGGEANHNSVSVCALVTQLNKFTMCHDA